MSSIPTQEPLVIIQGQSVTWKRTLSDYPADEGWALTYHLVKPGTKLSIETTDDGAGAHLVSKDKTATAAWPDGRYHAQGLVVKGDEAHVEFEGTFQIKKGFAAVEDGLDARSHEEKVLDALETALESKASLTPDQLSISVDGVSIGRMTWRQLLEARDEYKSRVEAGVSEDDQARGGGPRRVRGCL